MSRNPIEELRKEIKAEFTLLASVALARINRHFEAAGIEAEKRIRFSSEPLQNGKTCVHFYDDVPNEIPSVILLDHNVIRELIEKKPSEYGDLLAYTDKLHEKLIEIGGIHPKTYDLGYGSDYNSNVGFGINLPVKPNIPMKLRNLSAIALSGYPLNNIQAQIEGDVSIKLPIDLVISALTIRQSKAECDRDNPTRNERPKEYDLVRIGKLLSQALLTQISHKRDSGLHSR